MHRNLFTFFAASLLSWPALAQKAAPAPAESEQTEEGAEGEGAEEGTAPPTETTRQAKGDQIKGLEQAPGETHTVVKGDTLWDLSARYLQTPWYWPKVWSYNPEIANPHWIYPGQTVRFFPSGEEAPARVDVEPEEEAPAAPTEMSDVSKGNMNAPDLMGQDEDTVTMSGKIGYVGPGAGYMRRDGFVTQAELDDSGVIDHSPAEIEMLSTLDIAYIRFKTKAAKIGDRYIIYKTVSKIVHPKTGDFYGYLTHIQGTLRIAHIEPGGETSGVIDRAYDEINRGDYVAPLTAKFDRPLTPKANTHEMKGYVLATFIPKVTHEGEYDVIFVDKGKRDGVEEGNTFVVVRRSDGLIDVFDRAEDPTVPQEDLGQVRVLDVKDNASSCLVIRSIREIVVGDRVEMRLPRPKTAQR
jgi:LysM repeat protein